MSDEMDDDNIDIEEHDLMDNPVIKRMFPDLSVIKKEITEYYEDELLPSMDIPPEPGESNKSQQEKKNINHNTETKPRELIMEKLDLTGDETTFVQGNIIILGTKPSIKCQKIKELKIILEDQNSYLINCKKYCRDCFILFPNTATLDMHTKQYHTYEQISKSILNQNNLSDKLSLKKKTYKCDTCGTILSNSSNLLRHLNTVHKFDGKQYSTRRRRHKILPNQNTNDKLHASQSCFHCSTLFPSQKSLIDHLYDILDPSLSEQMSSKSEETKQINKEETKQLNKEDTNRTNKENTFKKAHIEKVNKHIVYPPDQDKKINEHGYNESPTSPEQNIESVDEMKNFVPPKTASKRIKPMKLSLNREKMKKKKMLLQVDETDDEKCDSVILKNHNCKMCAEKFISKRNLDHHIQTLHKEHTNTHKENFETTKALTTADLKQDDKLYRCSICSRYMMTFKKYSEHMIATHNMKIVDEVEKVIFDPQCKFCPTKSSYVKIYNIHLSKFHKDKLVTGSPSNENCNVSMPSSNLQFACKSILFKCIKCDIFFLSANEARDHPTHMELLINWKCSICQRIFKNDDKIYHQKQHTFSDNFTFYALSDTGLSRVLYKCLNCAIHFSENNYWIHYGKCDSEIPNSLYCNVCDILVNRADMSLHDMKHKQKKLSTIDFTIIETEIFLKYASKTNVNKSKQIYSEDSSSLNEIVSHRQNHIFTYCLTCKCFLSKRGFKRKAHGEGKCAQISKTICKDCGLVLPMKGLHQTHKSLHTNKEIVHLQDYVFYDFKFKKKIHPPLPDYPNCANCGVHFLKKIEIQQHVCSEQDYITCYDCKIKLTTRAYKLHMSFHEYKICNNEHEPQIILDSSNLNGPEKKTNSNVIDTVTNAPNSFTKKDIDRDECVQDTLNLQDPLFLYSCESCHITVSTYQKVVWHCQDHYDCKKSQASVLQCEYCPLKFDPDCYEAHKVLHLKPNYSCESYKMINFDPFYFRYSNNFWKKHIFAYVADDQIKNITESTIYQFECRLKMEITQSGSPDFTLYKCGKCQIFIDPLSLYVHAGNPCGKLNKYSCSFCGLSFDSQNYRATHEQVHSDPTINRKSFRIIIYNKKEHGEFNKYMFESHNRFILHQCRNCDVVVDKFCRQSHQCDFTNLKKCSACGLILYGKDYDLHFIRHEELDKFKVQFMIVVLFGKMNYKVYKALKPSFNGIINDLTFYKCKCCKLCFRSKENSSEHVCILGTEKYTCSECDLYFSKQEWKDHLSLHTNIFEFDKFNINIVNVDVTTLKSSNSKHKVPLEKKKEILDEVGESNVQNMLKERPSAEEKVVETMFKCDCGLHFLEELNAQHHADTCNPKMKISRQNCFKCDLMFTPGELFNHLLKHHCDKKLQLSFNIVMVTKK